MLVPFYSCHFIFLARFILFQFYLERFCFIGGVALQLAVHQRNFSRVVWNNCLTNPPLTGGVRRYPSGCQLDRLSWLLLPSVAPQQRTGADVESLWAGWATYCRSRRWVPSRTFQPLTQEGCRLAFSWGRCRSSRGSVKPSPSSSCPKWHRNLQMAKDTLQLWLDNTPQHRFCTLSSSNLV